MKAETTIEIRKITNQDDPEIEQVIKSVLIEFGVNRPGTAFYDESLKQMSEFYDRRNSVYFVGTAGNKILGGAGVFPTEGLPEGVCELVKMYLLPEARGIGLGKKLVSTCFDFARSKGYKKMYLETMTELENAVAMYEKSGFKLLDGPLGNTGHYACTIRMLKDL